MQFMPSFLLLIMKKILPFKENIRGDRLGRPLSDKSLLSNANALRVRRREDLSFPLVDFTCINKFSTYLQMACRLSDVAVIHSAASNIRICDVVEHWACWSSQDAQARLRRPSLSANEESLTIIPHAFPNLIIMSTVCLPQTIVLSYVNNFIYCM